MGGRTRGVGLLLVALGACKDQGKISEAKAVEHARALVALAEKDVGEVEAGLPEGAKRLAALYAKKGDPHQDVPGVRTALLRVRRDVPNLTNAKSTFFALADDKGVAIRNDLETDVMAGQNLVAIFPGLQKAIDGAYVETTGAFGGPPGKSGPDRDWIAAAPVKRDDGTSGGIFVTGWSFRRFAYHLQESLKHDLGEALLKDGHAGKLPVLYVAVFDKTGVYGAPQTPSVNEQALVDAQIADKTAGGPIEGIVSVTDRRFGYAAARVPKLGPDVGIAVLRSEID